MRFICAVLAILAAVALPAAAQDVGVGVKGGVTRMKIVFDDPAPVTGSSDAGIVVGGFATLAVWSRLSAQVEALFSERTTTFEDVVTDRLRYLEVPVLARYRVWSTGRLTVDALAGAHLAFLLDATESISGLESDFSEAVRPRDVAAVAGAAVTWGRVVVDARYLHGLSKLYVTPPAPAPEFPAYQRGFEITAGWRIF
jgi:hypothetical protein